MGSSAILPIEVSMKVLYLRTDFYGAVTDGGSFTMQKGIVSGLVEEGVEVEIVTSCPPPDHGTVPVHLIPYNRFTMNLPEAFSILHNGRVVRRLSPILTRFHPDVVYQRHSSHNISGAMVWRRYGIPYILQFDGSEVWMKTHWSKTFFPRMLRNAEKIALRCAQMVTVVSEPMRQMAIECGAEPNRVVIVPNGVDLERFSPAVPPHPIRQERGWNDAIVVGFVGTFDSWHGADLLAQALVRAIGRHPTLCGLFVGDGATFSTVIDIIHREQVADRVVMLGRCPHADIPSYLAACDILAVPTVPNPDGTEFFGSPTKLFEYMAMGKAIVASPLGQVRSIIRDGVTGLWFEPGNVNSLADVIVRLANDPTLREQLGRTARKEAVEHHSWSARARTLLSAWENIRASMSK
jgi:glycosyltransferase involved in cell wall biosynthesis